MTEDDKACKFRRVNFAKAVKLAMRNGFANFRKVVCKFRNAKFRIGCNT